MARIVDDVFMVNFAWELCKNDPTIKNYTSFKEPRDLAKAWDRKLDPIIYQAIMDFLVADKFFQVVGDKPMPKYTPAGLTDLVKLLVNAKTRKPVTDGDVLKRLKDNVLVKFALQKGVNKDIVALIKTNKT